MSHLIQTEPTERLHSLDTVRGFALLLGVALQHVSAGRAVVAAVRARRLLVVKWIALSFGALKFAQRLLGLLER